MNLKHFIKELQRRNVIKSALAYLVVAWLVTQVMAIVIPAFKLHESLLRTSIIVLIVCFPFWLIFSWIYEITPDGIKKTASVAPENSIAGKTSNQLNYIIIAGLVITIGLLIRNSIYTNATAGNEADITATATDKSIAVLAFADMSPEKDQEYFSDGISEEILNLLAQIPDLKVISRTSSFSFKGKEATTAEIGKTLNVTHILEGSIRKSGNTFRITVQLINVTDGAHIWSETYDREMSDIFKIQDEIASKVTQQLKVTLLGDIASTPVNTEAYNLYLQARQVYQQGTPEASNNAETLVRQAIAIDSSYARAWILLSKIIYIQIYSDVTLPMTPENIAIGIDAAKRAIALDPNNPFGYTGLAAFERPNWNFTAASANMKKALALAPENAGVIIAASSAALALGKLEDALQLYKKAVELDPLSYSSYLNLGLNYAMLEDYQNAEKYIQIYLLHYPSVAGVHSLLSEIYLAQGKHAKALEELEKESAPFWKLYTKSMVVYAMGNKQEADAVLQQLIEEWGDLAQPNIADVYAFRGEKDEAFKWLDLAYEQRDGSLLEILNYPAMKNLWGDSRWNKFINKLGLPDDHGFHLD